MRQVLVPLVTDAQHVEEVSRFETARREPGWHRTALSEGMAAKTGFQTLALSISWFRGTAAEMARPSTVSLGTAKAPR